jgi:hypothetical protein
LQTRPEQQPASAVHACPEPLQAAWHVFDDVLHVKPEQQSPSTAQFAFAVPHAAQEWDCPLQTSPLQHWLLRMHPMPLAMHAVPHFPDTQASPGWQGVAPPQHAWVSAPHAPVWHRPLWQSSLAPHAFVQLPQCAGSTATSTQLASQAVYPSAHAAVHRASPQVTVPLAGAAAQATHEMPQWLTSPSS